MNIDDVLRHAIRARQTWTEHSAIRLLENALIDAPNDPRLHQMTGVLLRELDENERALDCFEKAAALAPNDARIAHGLAQVRLDAGLDARDAFTRAATLAPQNRDLQLSHVGALLAATCIAQAESLLVTELQATPGWAEGHSALVRLRWQAGEGDASWRTLRKAIEQRPADLPLWRELILGLMHARKFEPALAAIRAGKAACAPDIFFPTCEAGCLDELGHYEAAYSAFINIGRAADAGVALRFTRHLLHAGRPEDAAAVALAWTDQPGAQSFWPYIATAWRMTNDPRWEWLEGDKRLVGVQDISSKIGSLDKLAAVLRTLHETSNHQPLEQSVRTGTQTSGRLFARIEPEIRELRAAVVEAVKAHMAQLPPMDARHPTLGVRPPDVRFSGSWSVRLTGEGHHSAHMHTQGWFSSAFYVVVPDDMDANEPEAGWLTLGDQPEFQGCPPAFRKIRPHAGKLALFPSNMWHGTQPIRQGERMTVAFDIAPGPPPQR